MSGDALSLRSREGKTNRKKGLYLDIVLCNLRFFFVLYTLNLLKSLEIG